MEEDEYKTTYSEIAENRCVFEKALTNNQCQCRYSRHFWLADREGYACNSGACSLTCSYLLEKLRENSRFFMKTHSVGSQLPHNADIRIQVGGLRGLRRVLEGHEDDSIVADVRALVEKAEVQYEQLDKLPFSDIVQSIASYQGRSRSKKGRKGDEADI